MSQDAHKGFHIMDVVGPALERVGLADKVDSDPVGSETPASTSDVSVRTAQQALSHEAPALPVSDYIPTVPVPAFTASAANDHDADVRKKADAYLAKVLQSAPIAFQDFLARQDELKKLLADVLSGEQLEKKSIEGALKASKLTTANVKNAMAAIREALQGLQADFVTNIQQRRKEQIDAPNQAIQVNLGQITAIQTQIATLEEQKNALQAGIEPARLAVAQADQHLREGESIFQRSCLSVTQTLTGMEQQLLTNLKGGK